MKKRSIFTLALAILLALTACGNKNDKKESIEGKINRSEIDNTEPSRDEDSSEGKIKVNEEDEARGGKSNEEEKDSEKSENKASDKADKNSVTDKKSDLIDTDKMMADIEARKKQASIKDDQTKVIETDAKKNMGTGDGANIEIAKIQKSNAKVEPYYDSNFIPGGKRLMIGDTFSFDKYEILIKEARPIEDDPSGFKGVKIVYDFKNKSNKKLKNPFMILKVNAYQNGMALFPGTHLEDYQGIYKQDPIEAGDTVEYKSAYFLEDTSKSPIFFLIQNTFNDEMHYVKVDI